MTGKKLSLFLALAAILTFFHNVEAARLSSAVLDDNDNNNNRASTSGGEQGSNPAATKALRGSGSTPRLLATTPSDSDASNTRSLSGDTPPLCPNAIENMFEVLMSPNTNYRQTKFHVFRLNPDLSHDRKVLAQNLYYSDAKDQSSSRCLYTIFCYKLIVYNTANQDVDGGDGSYKAYWNGELIKDEKFLDGSQSETYFGDCATTSPSISAAPSPAISLAPSVSTTLSVAPSARPVEASSASPSVSLAPSPPPVESPCPPGKSLFQMFMQPDSGKPRDVNYFIQRRKKGVFPNKKIHKVTIFEDENLPVDSVCLNEGLCLRITVQSRSGQGIGDGVFSAKWEGKDVVFLDYNSFTTQTVSMPAGLSCW